MPSTLDFFQEIEIRLREASLNKSIADMQKQRISEDEEVENYLKIANKINV